MKNRMTVYALAMTLAVPGLALAQSTASPATNTPVKPAPSSIAPLPVTSNNSSATTATYITADQMTRASKIIGATVYNDQNQSVGSINELLIDNSRDVSGVVLSVGGFLGIDSKLVKVPFQDIHVTGDRLVMSGASKDQLKEMPEYKIVPAKAS